MKKLTEKNGQCKEFERVRLLKFVLLAFALVSTLIILSSNCFALGVAPSREIIDYKEGLQTLSARIINNDHTDMRVAIYPKGELAPYVKIKEGIIVVNDDEGEKSFEYTIDLPKDLEPGSRELDIVLVQLPEVFADSDENLVVTDEKAVLFASKDESSMVSATTAVIHQLRVNVPYPDSYMEGRMYVSEGKVGDKLTFTIPVVNRGSSSAEVYADIRILGPTNEEIASFKTQKVTVEGLKEDKLVGEWVADANEGSYVAEAVVHYGSKYFKISKDFSIGSVVVSIEDLKVENFKLGGIAKLDVYLKNKWNERITNVFGELKVLDKNNNVMSSFNTLNTEIDPYGESVVNGYWDTSGVDVGQYDVNVIIHYAGKTSEKLFQTIVGIDKISVGQATGQVAGSKDEGNSLVSLLVILVIVLIAVNIGWFVFLRKRFKKPPKEPTKAVTRE